MCKGVKVLNAEYVIFLSDKFFSKFTKHKVLKYFDKYDILYLNYHKKDEVLEILNLINMFIKSGNEKEKKDFLRAIPNSKIKKLKINYFLENNIELNTLYKENKNEGICDNKNDNELLDTKNIELDIENDECKNDDK